MPRMEPPPGHVTAKKAQERLGVSYTLLRKYVKEGLLNRYGPTGRAHKPWYNWAEVEALYHTLHTLEAAYVGGGYKNNPTHSFELATPSDMPAILDIDERTFGEGAASLETCLAWQKKNPHTFYVLKNEAGGVRGYASLIPMDQQLINAYVHDELNCENITADMVDEYAPNKPMHIYVMALAVSPDCDRKEKNLCGGHMVLGLFRFLLGLAGDGVDVRTITARNYMGRHGLNLKDGLRLLRKIGFTQVKSPVEGVGLFVINVPESGIGIFQRYTSLLESWRAEHSQGKCA